MADTTGALLSALVSDVMGALGLPAGTLLGEAIKAVMKRRMDAAREILLDELRRGDKTLMDAELEEAAAILWRYQRAAQEGAARINLRLLARVIAGQAHMGNLKADEFLYYADVIASLRREEIYTLGALWRGGLIKDGPMLGDRDAYEKMITLMRQLVPALLPTKADVWATLSALTRTGLVVAETVKAGEKYPVEGGIEYRAAPLMGRLVKLASFEGLE